MSVIRSIRLQLGLAWERFATRTGLRAMPAVPTVAAVLALGLAIPLMGPADNRPPALARSLAVQRLESFLQQHTPPADVPRPVGGILDPRPVLRWAALPGASSYGVVLRSSNGIVLSEMKVAGTEIGLPAGTALEPGDYRLSVTGRPEGGTVEGLFRVVAASPAGGIYTGRPAFHWLPVAKAARYRVRLFAGRNEEHAVVDAVTEAARYRVRPPAGLPAGSYSLVAQGLDADGNDVGAARRTTFEIRPLADADRELQKAMQLALQPSESALVTAGYYASKNSPHDVVSALETYLAEGADGADRDLALRVLEQRGLKQ